MPRVRVPEEKHWPVGLGFAAELGLGRPDFNTSFWSLELRPIIDKKIGKLCIAFNPVIAKVLDKEGTDGEFECSPNGMISYELSEKLSPAVEYYASLGPLKEFNDVSEQLHHIFIATEIKLDPRWELNVGYGFTVNSNGEDKIVKLFIGRIF